MNFLQLCQRLRQETGISDSGPGTVTSQTGDMKRLIDWTQDAWMRLQTLRPDWQFMWFSGEFIVTGSEVDKPATVGEFIEIRKDGVKLQEVHYRDFSKTPSILEYAILPNGRIRFNTELDNVTLTFEAYRKPAYFTEGIEVPSLPERFHMIIVWIALMDYALFDEAGELSQKARLHFEQMLAELDREQLPDCHVPGALA